MEITIDEILRRRRCVYDVGVVMFSDWKGSFEKRAASSGHFPEKIFRTGRNRTVNARRRKRSATSLLTYRLAKLENLLAHRQARILS